MAKPADTGRLAGLASRFGAFAAEQHPFALGDALAAVTKGCDVRDEAGIEKIRPVLRQELAKRLEAHPRPEGLPETTPRTSVAARMKQAHAELFDACDGFLRRAA